uniref:Insulin n=1 Tax=Conus varius TaxID=89448 RepID=A0A1B3IIZ5_CONVA|nr:insulin precursor [Conus varius]
MMTSSYFLLVALGLLLYVHQASSQEYECDETSTPDPNGVCGNELINLVRQLCEDDEEIGKKRSTQRKRRQVFQLKKQRFLLKRNIKRNPEGYSGLNCECCKHHCNYSEYVEYCESMGE